MKKNYILLCLLFITSLIVAQNKIELATTPFSKAPTSKTEFKAIGDHVYAKLSLDKPIKNYACELDNYQKEMQIIPGTFVAKIQFRINFLDPELENAPYTIMELFLKESDLSKTELFFDIIPSAELATSCYSAGFYDELASSSKVYRYFGTKKEVQIELYRKSTKALENDILVMSTKFTMDYTDVDYENITQWKSDCSAIHTKINNIYFK